MNGGSGGERLRLRTIDSLDGRTASARRARDLVAGLEEDAGGSEHISVATKQLVQRAAILGALIEDFEARWLGGQQIDVAELLMAVNCQRRVLATLGLERKARDVLDPLGYAKTRAEAGQ